MPGIAHSEFAPTELCRRLNAFVIQLTAALSDGAREAQSIVAQRVADGTPPYSYAATYEAAVSPITAQLHETITVSVNQPPGVRVLCAFGSVLDQTCNLEPDDHEGLRRLLDWIEIQSARPVFTHGEPSSDVKKTVRHPRDILSLLRIAFVNADGKSAGGKSRVEDLQLRQALLDSQPSFPAERISLGGAPAIISDTLNQLGVDACFYAPYHAPEVAQCFSENTGWLDLNSADFAPVPARSSGQDDHPTRHGIALAYGGGPYPYPAFFLGGEITVAKSDRLLLVLKHPVHLRASRPWTSWALDGAPQDMGDLATNEWPNRAAFLKWELSQDTLEFTPVNDDLLRQLGQRYSYVVLSAPQLGDLATPKDSEKPVNRLLRGQLQTLCESGAILHLEISGDASGADLDTFAMFLKDTIHSVGVNADELPGYARLASPGKWDPPPDQGKEDASPSPVRYQQALALARKLQVERLYVHGNDVDIILRRNTSFDVMRRDATGDLFAKAVVLIATILRNGSYVPGNLVLPTDLGEKTRKAMTDAITMKVGGLEAARAYADRLHGMVCPIPEEDGFRGAIIPCIWLGDIPRRFSATGAGDITSGVSLVYSGFRETRQDLSSVRRTALA